MAQVSFEFVVIGSPFSVNLARKQSKKHADWKREVGRAAKAQWLKDGRPAEGLPLSGPMEVTITTFFTALQKDVDNVVKPILDGLKQVIYVDDGEIYKLTSQRIDLKTYAYAGDLSRMVATALETHQELVQVILTWEVKEEFNANRTSVAP